MSRRVYFILVCCSAFLFSQSANAFNFLKGSHGDTTVQTASDDAAHEEDLQQQLKNTEMKIAQLNIEMTSLTQQLKTENTELEKLQQQQDLTQAELTKQKTTLAQQVKIVYELGQSQGLKTLLNPDDLNSTNRHLYYYRSLNEARLKSLTDIKQTLAALETSMAAIKQHENNLKTMLAQKQKQQHNLQLTLTKREQVVVALKTVQTKVPETKVATTNQKALQTTLATALDNQEIEVGTEAYKNVRGKLPWPIQGPIVASFGSTSESHQHLRGVVIKATEGTPVHAVTTGKVIFANWLRGFGLLVIINHGDGYMSLYGRNQALYAQVGDTVKPGDVIAAIGNSGGYAKSSLYFEIRHNGTPIDPHTWCA
jgi:septal ring factor EnvC (AmiA/AmiB activator)